MDTQALAQAEQCAARASQAAARTSQELRSLAEPTATGSEAPALFRIASLRFALPGGMSETSPGGRLRALPECLEQLLPGPGDLPARHGGQGFETAACRLPRSRRHGALEAFQATCEDKMHWNALERIEAEVVEAVAAGGEPVGHLTLRLWKKT